MVSQQSNNSFFLYGWEIGFMDVEVLWQGMRFVSIPVVTVLGLWVFLSSSPRCPLCGNGAYGAALESHAEFRRLTDYKNTNASPLTWIDWWYLSSRAAVGTLQWFCHWKCSCWSSAWLKPAFSGLMRSVPGTFSYFVGPSYILSSFLGWSSQWSSLAQLPK